MIKLTFPIKEQINSFVEKIQIKARNNNVYLNCNDNIWNFSGSGVSGEFYFNAESITVRVNKKPWYVSWNLIETKMRNLLYIM